jgi:hypothetical protein
MMMQIKCPKCATEGSISLLEPNYQGPYRCWKCRELFQIRIENNKVVSSQPITEEDLKKIQEMQALRDKFKKKSDDD